MHQFDTIQGCCRFWPSSTILTDLNHFGAISGWAIYSQNGQRVVDNGPKWPKYDRRWPKMAKKWLTMAPKKVSKRAQNCMERTQNGQKNELAENLREWINTRLKISTWLFWIGLWLENGRKCSQMMVDNCPQNRATPWCESKGQKAPTTATTTTTTPKFH